MSKRELVLNALNGKPVNRVPIGFWFHFADEKKLFDGLFDESVIETSFAGHRKFYNDFQPDFIKIMSDGWFEYPNQQLKSIKSAGDLYGIKALGPDHEWIERQITHVKKLTDIFGQDIVSFYNIFSPSKYLRLLYGQEGDALLARLIIEDKEAVIQALAVIAQDLGHLAEGVIERGKADGIYFSVQNIQDPGITPEQYSEIFEPSDIYVLKAANRASDNNILHICGYEGSRNDLNRFTHYESKAVNWAVHVENIDLATGKELFGNRAVIGGFDNRAEGILYSGSQTEIENAVTEILGSAGTTGILLGADCSLPADIDLGRLDWVRQKASKLSGSTVNKSAGNSASNSVSKSSGKLKSVRHAGLITLILAIAVSAIAGCQSSASDDSKPDPGESAQKATTKVRIAHTQAYYPYDFVNESGESDGFEVQVMKAVDELVPEFEFEFVPTSDDDLLIGIESGKYQGGTKGAWFTTERSEKYLYPENYIGASVIGLAIRSENAAEITDIESFAKFSGKLVPIAPQSAQWAIVKQYNDENPENQIELTASETFNVADAYIWVLEGRYDGYFDIQLSYQNNILKEDAPYAQYAELLTYVPYKGIPTWPLFNKKEEALSAAYDEALIQLRNNGRISELSEEYFGEDIFRYIED